VPELAQALFPYLMAVIGFLIVWVLNGIRSDVKELKDTMRSEAGVMWTELKTLRSEVTELKTGCAIRHRQD
jgi:hypothetical protein